MQRGKFEIKIIQYFSVFYEIRLIQRFKYVQLTENNLLILKSIKKKLHKSLKRINRIIIPNIVFVYCISHSQKNKFSYSMKANSSTN